jgi:hypothetical protein
MEEEDVFIRYPPASIRYEGDQPLALLGVRIAPTYHPVDLPLGPPPAPGAGAPRPSCAIRRRILGIETAKAGRS